MKDNSSYKKDLGKKRFRYDEDRDALVRGLNDMRALLQQGVYLLAIIAIVLLAMFLGSVALIMLGS